MTAVLATLPRESGDIQLRRATVDDLPDLVRLLAADPLGSARENTAGPDHLKPYLRAFEAIDADPAHILVVATDGPAVVATLQLTFIPGLAHQGALRAQIEAVRVAESHQSQGLGTAIFAWAIDEARRRGCALVQLTTDKRRNDAHRFYQRLGFVASHEGMKLPL